MKRPNESDYTSQVAYTRALEEYCDTLAQPAPVQEPVAWISPKGNIHFDPYLDSAPLYTTPPAAQRTWVGSGDLEDSNAYQTPPTAQRKPLTDEEIESIAAQTLFPVNFARAIEAKLKEKNT